MEIVFFKYPSKKKGKEPLKEWLKEQKNFKTFDENELTCIMADIKAVSQDWSLCLKGQLSKKLGQDLWEIRSRLSKRTVRIFFTQKDNLMVLLHGFVKKTQEIPRQELKKGQRRRNQWHKEDRRK